MSEITTSTTVTTTSAPPSALPQSSSNNSRKQWLEQSILRRMVTPVKTTVAEITAASPFLSSASSTTAAAVAPCAVFARHELVIDPTPVGTGGFSTVHAITSIVLDDDVSARCDAARQSLRVAMRDAVWSDTNYDHGEDDDGENAATSGRHQHPPVRVPRFVLKQLQRQLLMAKPKVFQCALRDLAIEIEYMSRLSHPNILPLLGRPIDGLDAINASGGSLDSFFLVTERLETTLNYKIKEWNVGDPPSLEQRMPYVEQLGKALAYLHRHRIVFRDLKPANVGISMTVDTTRPAAIKLFDFGLCRELPAAAAGDGNSDGEDYHHNHSKGDANRTTAASRGTDPDRSRQQRDAVGDTTYVMSGVGTQRYMAAEILAGCPYNCKVDVYGWALLSWEILMGCRPYLRHGNAGHMEAVLVHSERPVLPLYWPTWLRNVLQRSWCRDISERYTMAQALAIIQAELRPKQRCPTVTANPNHCNAIPPPRQLRSANRSSMATTTSNNANSIHHVFLREQSLALSHRRGSGNENHNHYPARLAVPVRVSSVYW